LAEVDAVIIGGGVVGIACALSLSRRGLDVLILEADSRFGSGTSSRSSEVIHAGLYYPEGSLKARLCVAGRKLLYDYCRSRNVPHRAIGKLVFASTDAELAGLQSIAERAAGAGVDSLRYLDASEVRRIEPELRCVSALHSPETGIVDSHAFMLTMLAEVEDRGGMLACNTRFTGARLRDGLWDISIDGSAEPIVRSRLLINSAGLGAQAAATAIEGLDPAQIPPLHFARGCYFSYSGKLPFQRLIYPLPVPGGLGVHLTFDLQGKARFGPDLEWIDAIDHTVDPGRKSGFVAAARRIWPAIDPDRLQPDYAGIRPKLARADSQDFLVSTESAHGLPGLVNLYGIESPGLTAALALGEEVAAGLAD